MKNSWWNKFIPLLLLGTVLIQCGKSKSATTQTEENSKMIVSPNNAPDQAAIDSIKQIETLKKEQTNPPK